MSSQKKVSKRKTGKPASHASRQSRAAAGEAPADRMARVVMAVRDRRKKAGR